MQIIEGTVNMTALDDGRRQLTKLYRCDIDGVRYEIPEGFVWDGASLPKAAWTLYGHPYDAIHLQPGLWHDAVYGGLFSDVSRAQADKVYRAWLQLNGMSTFKSLVEWSAVRMFGGSHWTN